MTPSADATHTQAAQKSADTARFLDLYVDLLTQPVPVTLSAGQGVPADDGP
jgi:hypothetical protein